jgi:acetyl esterase/lipase
MTAVDHRLDPDIREALAATPFQPITADGLAARRAQFGAFDTSLLSERVARTTLMVPGPSGSPDGLPAGSPDVSPDVKLRVHRPVGVDGPLPCLYWMHGGGLVVGDCEQDDLRFDRWCARHNMMAVSVDYRLAPETRYPGAIEDCFAGLVALHTASASLGVDVARICIGGASAGGGLAAALALLARDRGLPGPPIASQLLIYPMIDDRQITKSSGWDVPIWPPSSNRFGWDSYLGDLSGDAVPIYAAAARALDLSGLPPALIIVGALDGFVDENVDYATRLNHAGVDVELHLYPGAPHGFDGLLPGTGVAKTAASDIHRWIARIL